MKPITYKHANAPGKRVAAESGTGVQIPLFPPENKQLTQKNTHAKQPAKTPENVQLSAQKCAIVCKSVQENVQVNVQENKQL